MDFEIEEFQDRLNRLRDPEEEQRGRNRIGRLEGKKYYD